MDPLAEKYYHLSPYAYCAGDPVNLVDPDGRKIEDPDKLVIKFKQRIEDNIKILSGLSEDKNAPNISQINKVLKECQTILKELDVLEKSDDVFRVEHCAQKDGGEIYWNKGVVIIEINNKTDYGLIGHELKHAYQFIQGEISFDHVTGGGGVLYDISDEKKAFSRQVYISSGIHYQYEIDEYLKVLEVSYSNLNKKSCNIRTRNILKTLYEKKDIYRIPK